jgi:Uma2 family endonuclease
MATLTEPITYTPEDLLAMPDGTSYELVDGHLVERNVSVISSWVGGELHGRLREYCRAHNLGLVWPADNGIQCFPDAPNKVRRPDVSFVRQERLTAEVLGQGHLRIVPDLVAEVISPNDSAEELDEKITEYQDAGVRLIWVVNPDAGTVRAYRTDGSTVLYRLHQDLDGEDVLPGFRCPVRDLFPPSPSAPNGQ